MSLSKSDSSLSLYISQLVELAKTHDGETIEKTIVQLDKKERRLFFSSVEDDIAASPGLHISGTKKLVSLLTRLRKSGLYQPPQSLSKPNSAPNVPREIVEKNPILASRVLCIWDFLPEGDKAKGKLAFHKGDVLRVVEHVSDEWWRGTRGSQRGLFPRAYTKDVPLHPPLAIAVFEFKPETGAVAQLPLYKGALLSIISEKGEWCEGILGSRAGKFPSSFVRRLEGAEAHEMAVKVADTIIPDVETDLHRETEEALDMAKAELDRAEATLKERIAAVRTRASLLRERSVEIARHEDALDAIDSLPVKQRKRAIKKSIRRRKVDRSSTNSPELPSPALIDEEAPPLPPEDDDCGSVPLPLEDDIPPPPEKEQIDAAKRKTGKGGTEEEDEDDEDDDVVEEAALDVNHPLLWREAKTPDGRIFWFNRRTRDVRWTAPPRRKGARTFRPSEWRSAVSARGRKYYYNSLTRETRWTKPTRNEKPLRYGWREATSPDGDLYYYNSETRETTWDRPSRTNDDSTSDDSSGDVDISSSSSVESVRSELPEASKVKMATTDDLAAKKKRQEGFATLLKRLAVPGSAMRPPAEILDVLQSVDDDVDLAFAKLTAK